MKKILRKTLKITGICLLVLLALAFLVPLLFKKQITNLVKKEINKSLVATVDFSDVRLSLFRHFPKLTVSLNGLSVVGTGNFSKDTLISAHSVDAAVNLVSIIRGNEIKVYGVTLESPRIHALVNDQGQANWDIARPSGDTTGSTDTSASAFNLKLEQYAIHDGYVLYNDKSSGIYTEISGLDHKGSGDLTADLFTLNTSTRAKHVDFSYAAIPYLSGADVSIESGIQVNNRDDRYDFKTGAVKVNGLQLNAEGFFQLASDTSYAMDIRFATPGNAFRDILSLVPAIYKQDFDKIKTSGQASLKGFVKGIYSPARMPAYDVSLLVNDGFFQYPDLPKPVKNIQVAAHISNADGTPDNLVVDISRGHMEMDNSPFDFRLLYKNPETAPWLDAMAKGNLELATVSNFIKLENNTRLSGMLKADVYVKGLLSAMQQQAGEFTAGGFVDLQQLFYSSDLFPQPVQNGNMQIKINNTGGIADQTSIEIPGGHVEIGKDPIDFSLQVTHPVTTIPFSGTVRGRFTLDKVKQFTSLAPGTSVSGDLTADLSFSGTKQAIDKGAYDEIKLDGSAALKQFVYQSADYPGGIRISHCEIGFSPSTATLRSLEGNYLGTNFQGNGRFDNLVGYALKNESLSGNLSVGADKVDLNAWMGTGSSGPGTSAGNNTASTAATDPFLVPANMDLTLTAKAGTVTYDKVDYKNIDGTLRLSNETVQLQQVKTETLDGTVIFNGSYSTLRNKKQPEISMGYEMKDISVQKAFFAFNTFQKLMPIGQFLDGKLNSQLNMKGNLQGDMMPDIGSLSGKGNFLLVEGVLKKFAPLEKIANTLQIDELKSVSVRDIKNYIEFANGKVLVKPFTVKVKDIEMEIGGLHGIDQSIDYRVQMKLPRKYLGTQGNNLVNSLASQASNKGIPVKLGETVNLSIQVGGSMTNPSIKTDLKEAAGDAVKDLQQQAADFAKAKADTVKQVMKDTLTAVKNQVLQDLKQEAKNRLLGTRDSAGNSNNLDSTKKKAGQKVKNAIDGLLKRRKGD